MSGKKDHTKYMVSIIIAVSFLSVLCTEVPASSQKSPVTPYGDFSPECGRYGTCKTTMTDSAAQKVLKNHYNKKGLDVEVVDIKGRFIKAKIIKDDEIVDIIIFDRQTGRIRSIY